MAVAYVAYQQLSPEKKDRVDALLKLNPDRKNWLVLIPKGTSKEDRRAMIFMIAATWPDRIKGMKTTYTNDTANGDIPVTRGALPFTNAGTGGPAGHFLMEDLENPLAPTSLVELVLPPHINAALGASGAPPHFANYASLGIPPAIGSFTYDPAADAVSVNWPGSDPRVGSFLAAAQRTLAKLDQRNGSLTLGFNPYVSAHPLGGAVLGKACEFNGQVKGHPGLFVVDGALIEGFTGLANPSFTIAALAERCLDRILEGKA